jgi:hypothetical protein
MSPRSLTRRVLSLEKTAVPAGATCTCSGPLVVWDPLFIDIGLAAGGGDRSARCGACGQRREVIRVVFDRRPTPDQEAAA